MKVFVQIPCLNEEQTLPMVLDTIPKELPGVDSVEVLIIDDGSTDRTIEVAQAHGVKHIVRHARNMGLARSFRDGVDYALAHGADIVVNTDGDNQYKQERIADLVAPVIAGEADIAIADRQTKKIAHFSPFKKVMQQVGSHVVNLAAETELPDAASGFRAYSKGALLRLNVITQFSYCMETIIQAGNKRLRIASVPIDTNPKTRESRLFNNIFQHMAKSGSAIVRAYLMFKPHQVLLWIAIAMGVLGAIPFVRFLYFFVQGQGGGHTQSLVFGSTLLMCSFMSLVLMIIADLQRTNRTLIEESLERLKRLEYGDPALAAAPLPRAGAPVASYDPHSAGEALVQTAFFEPASPQERRGPHA
ncbi:glycosyltransferase family 2 protein [Brachybacterium sp. p3-SID1565]|uniref:Glycosyltransferase family 2 protein n=1 Tax=Brachybacterium epidermidis TaxID=2781983 RepID=A0ABR9W0L6_9MICO|nr:MULTISPECIES: glycosyltransferase family 2 protein [Brachybacterium]MBE9403495.1 glycosyltransferase family 2 protein [Brachybacterium epidermidis]MCT1385094.1 glycosyltransferase family 2 protein [Brachybacterium sp. p3-SID1565]